MDVQKLTEEEIIEIKNLSNEFNQVFLNIGVIQTQIAELEARRDDGYEFLTDLRTKEKEIFQKLKEKYGEGVVDMNTGEFKAEK